MNRKITLLLIAAVTAILPAVAVADVMITGQFALESYHHHTAFEFQPGPNYAAANATNSIGWTSSAQGATMGQIDLEGSLYVTTYMINVIDLNFTVSNPAAPASFMGLYLNISSSTFPVGTEMVLATSALTFAVLMSTSVTHYSGGTPIAFDAGSSSTAVAVDLSENPHVLLTGFSPTQTIYIGYLLPAGYYGGSSATLTGQFVAFA